MSCSFSCHVTVFILLWYISLWVLGWLWGKKGEILGESEENGFLLSCLSFDWYFMNFMNCITATCEQ